MCQARVKDERTSCQQKLADTVQGAFYSVFSRWGNFVARRPLVVIVTSFLFALLCMTRLFMSFGGGDLALESETEAFKLWVPQDAQAVDDKDKYEAVWTSNYRYNQIFFTTNPEGGNVLTSTTLKEVARFDNLAWQNITAMRGKKNNGRGDYEPLVLTAPNATTFHSLCERAYGASGAGAPGCMMASHPLDPFSDGNGGYKLDLTDAEILDIINSGKGVSPELYPPDSSKTFNVEAAYGGFERDADGKITSAKAIKLVYLFKDDERDEPIQVAAHAWESQLNLVVGDAWAADPPHSEGSVWTEAGGRALKFVSGELDVYPWTMDAISIEGGKLIRGDVPMLSAGIMLISVYAIIVLARFDRIASRALLAVAGLVSCGLAIGISYGLATSFGCTLNPVINVLPFILIGIGVDDMFVLCQALEFAPIEASVPERMALAMGQAGVSISITSFTDFFAFMLGTVSSLPALSTFCIFAAVGILGDFLMQVTFFAGWMALDAYREKKKKIDCCPCCCAPIVAISSAEAEGKRRGCCCVPTPCATPKGGPLRYIINRFYIPALRPTAVKAVLVAVFVGYCGFSGWAASNLKQDFSYRWFVNDDAQIQKAFDIQDDYFTDGGLQYSIVTPASSSFDYTSIMSQGKLVDLKAEVEANKWVDPGSTSSWYTEFVEWAAACSNSTAADCSGVYVVDATGTATSGLSAADAFVPPDRFWAWLHTWLTQNSAGSAQSANVVWNDEADPAEGLLGARLRSMYVQTDDAQDSVDMMKTMRSSVDNAGIAGAYPYMQAYLFYEQYDIIVQEAILNLCLALVAVFVICLVIMADLRAALLVVLCVVMVDVDILGLMWMWDLTIDSVTIINLVLAIGLSVDYSAHVAHAFCTAPGTHQERMEAAISEMGTAVIHGGISTFVAVLVLSTAKSYVFRVFFKMFFGICLFGMAHGLIFLPCALYFVGPPPLKSIARISASRSSHSIPGSPRAKAPAQVSA